MYPGSQFMPWVSTPRRSARVRDVAIWAARSGGTLCVVRRVVAKVCAAAGEMYTVVMMLRWIIYLV